MSKHETFDIGFRQVSSETIEVTADIVAQFRAMERAPVERPLSEGRVDYLAAKIEAGLFHTPVWAKVIFEGIELRMNGQHSSAALEKAGIPEGLMVHLDTYEADSVEAMAELFRQFDARNSARTPSDVAGAYQGIVAALAAVDRKVAKQACEGIAWYEKTIEGVQHGGGDDRYRLMEIEKYHAFIIWLGGIINSKTPELTPIVVTGAVYGTFIAAEADARAFWESVAVGGKGEENDPATTLDEWLREPGEKKEKRKQLEVFNGCIFAWNAHRRSKPLPTVKTTSQKGFLKIAD